MNGMTDRERFLRIMQFKDADRIPYWENLGFWPETLDRWRSEGLPEGIDLKEYYGILYRGSQEAYFELLNFFDFDRREMLAIGSYRLPGLFYLGPVPMFRRRVLEETAQYRIIVDELGIKKKESRIAKSQYMPQFLEYPVRNEEDLDQMKRRFDPNSPRRYPENWREIMKTYSNRDYPVGVEVYGFFGQPREMLGLPRLLTWYFKYPQLVHDILDFWLEFTIRALKKPLSEVQVDYAIIWEDMSYRHGPMISPKLFEEFLLPRYRRLTNFFRSFGINIIMVDSDGNCELLNPLWLEGGVTCVYPNERQAGMNPKTLREKYGEKLALIGGIDKRVLASSPKAIEKELYAILPYLISTRGYIPSVDHVVPADVSLGNYLYYWKTVRKITNEVTRR